MDAPLFAVPTPTITPRLPIDESELELPLVPEVPFVPFVPVVPPVPDVLVDPNPLVPLLPPIVAPPNPELSAFVEVTLVDPPAHPPAAIPPPDCIPAADPKLAASPPNSCPKNT